MIRATLTPHEQLARLINGQLRDENTIIVGTEHVVTTSDVTGVVRLNGTRVLGMTCDGPLALAQAFDEAVGR